MIKKPNENLPKNKIDNKAKFMGKTLHTNDPTVSEDKVWSKQPTSKYLMLREFLKTLLQELTEW
jgi:hypothetical protein